VVAEFIEMGRLRPRLNPEAPGCGCVTRICSLIFTEYFPGPTVSGRGARRDEVIPNVDMTSPPVNILKNCGGWSSARVGRERGLFRPRPARRAELESHGPGSVFPFSFIIPSLFPIL
jgi:hypothetical protein